MKYIFVTGGVLSGIGKGVCSSSIGRLLKQAGMKPTHVKIDPYINIDAGTMSPFEHGECFVLDDGGETDLDLGNYERFVNIRLTKNSNLTTGKIYQKVIAQERKGDFLGKTVQIVPHLTNAIQDWIVDVAGKSVEKDGSKPNVCILELGGTVGDIESAPFVEALRQFQLKHGRDNVVFCHVSLVPDIFGEQKTKPTQHSIQTLRSLGLQPDFLFCRSKEVLKKDTKEKLALFSQVDHKRVLSLYDVPNIFHVPLVMKDQEFCQQLSERLKVKTLKPDLKEWRKLAQKIDSVSIIVQIALVGKYTNSPDAYLSVVKSLEHASLAVNRKLEIVWIEAEDLHKKDKNAWSQLHGCDGVIVPGGFGERGIEGKIDAIRYARANNVPFLGICLGMQAAVIEYARNVCGIKDANSSEFNKGKNSKNDIVIFMPEGDKTKMGGTMRLGARKTIIEEDTLAHNLYGEKVISERHRHRYEVNTKFVKILEKNGMKFSGKNLDSAKTGERMEIVEIFSHEYFIATQYHPEFQSTPGNPSPVFLGLLQASSKIS